MWTEDSDDFKTVPWQNISIYVIFKKSFGDLRRKVGGYLQIKYLTSLFIS